jgi:hypothetical protein
METLRFSLISAAVLFLSTCLIVDSVPVCRCPHVCACIGSAPYKIKPPPLSANYYNLTISDKIEEVPDDYVAEEPQDLFLEDNDSSPKEDDYLTTSETDAKITQTPETTSEPQKTIIATKKLEEYEHLCDDYPSLCETENLKFNQTIPEEWIAK